MISTYYTREVGDQICVENAIQSFFFFIYFHWHFIVIVPYATYHRITQHTKSQWLLVQHIRMMCVCKCCVASEKWKKPKETKTILSSKNQSKSNDFGGGLHFWGGKKWCRSSKISSWNTYHGEWVWACVCVCLVLWNFVPFAWPFERLNCWLIQLEFKKNNKTTIFFQYTYEFDVALCDSMSSKRQ